jgi:hypothetical protein
MIPVFTHRPTPGSPEQLHRLRSLLSLAEQFRSRARVPDDRLDRQHGEDLLAMAAAVDEIVREFGAEDPAVAAELLSLRWQPGSRTLVG